MENICSRCGNPAAADFDFCPECGQNLAVPISSLNIPPDTAPLHPWRRYWARTIDAAAYAAPLLLFIQWSRHDPTIGAFLYGADFFSWRAYLIYSLLFLLIQLALEPWLLFRTGTTLGKRLLRIQIKNESPRPTYRQYLKRTALLSFYGYGLNIPIFNFFCMWRSKSHLTANKTTLWDKKTHTRLIFHEIPQLDVYLYLICAYTGISFLSALLEGICSSLLGWTDTIPPALPMTNQMNIFILILSMLVPVAISIFSSACVFKDARKRGRSSVACFLWLGASLLLWFFTVPLWLLTRPALPAVGAARQKLSWRTGCGCGLGCGCGCLSVILGLCLFAGGFFAYNASAQGPEKSAIALYDFFLKWMPNNPVLYAERGEIHAIRGNDTQAIEDFSTAIALVQNLNSQQHPQTKPTRVPSLVKLYQSRGTLYDQAENYPAAIHDFTQAITLEPDNSSLYNDRGCIYTNAAQYPKAVADFTRAIYLDPKYADAYSNRAWVYELISENELADADYQKAEYLQ